jgi:hypothetical protein
VRSLRRRGKQIQLLFIAFIEQPEVIEKILTHLGL